MFENVYTVSEVNAYIKNIFRSDSILNNIYIKGEISNFKCHVSGHIYFTLKDSQSAIRCVMFRQWASVLKFMPADGIKIIAQGYISVYEKDGQYQFYVQEVQPEGKGALYLAYQQLKDRLEKEGLFDSRHKKTLPKLPKKIAIVTSSTGAAVRDIIKVSKRRYPNISLMIIPVLVQGQSAANDIADAIRYVNKRDDIDLVIVGRGGGSIEELWAFNEEVVAREIFKCNKPVISAVGHETDYTIADFVSDLRAPTPSAAAELAVPEKHSLENAIEHLRYKLNKSIGRILDNKKNKFNMIKSSRTLNRPMEDIQQKRQTIDHLNHRMLEGYKQIINLKKMKHLELLTKLDGTNPLKILAKGYVLTYDSNNSLVKSVAQLAINEKVSIRYIDGRAICEVLAKEEKNNEG
ncbi:MAG TPA: exodeoxyribonuclease VII large subunit [Clostridiales bacterium]|nr:exodeoxyribonuclease VII large subunit [Clostridiales bacterium]